jgi:glyceraldehyde 3-phosphate dehydrogenase
MSLKIAINGYGRIGRNILRALYEGKHKNSIKIIAVNDMADVKTNVHLTRYDSTHGRFSGNVEILSENSFSVNGDVIQTFSERDPSKLPWASLGIDIVFECTGLFTNKEKAIQHITAGAKKVIISAPGENVDATIVYGVNHNMLRPEHTVISNASCTTNCLAPLAKVLNDSIGIEHGLMTTIHSYTNDQVLVDSYHKDLHRARSATQSMIPTKTGAASAIGLVLPELKGKLDGFAMRVPTVNVSVVDLTFTAKKSASVQEINEIIKFASENEMKNILSYSDEPLVSIDFNHNPASSIYDSTQTKAIGNLVKVLSWYDNEWGFSNRMLDTADVLMNDK